MIIKLKTEYKDDYISRVAGENLRKKMVNSKNKITVDFENQIIASISFLDEGFAKLILEGWSKEKIKKNIEFKNIHPRDKDLIDKLIQNQIEELK